MQAKYKNCIFFASKFVGTVFVCSFYDSVTSSHVITESSVILA